MVGYAIYIGAALFLSLAAVLALAMALEFERHARRIIVPALYALILLNACLAPILYGRNLFVPDPWGSATGFVKWLDRLVVLTLLGACVARLVAAGFSGENRGTGGSSLLVAFGLLYLTTIVLSSALGTNPSFKHDQHYVPFLFAAVYASRNQDPEIAIRFAKTAMLVFLGASCAVALVAPQYAIELNYRSLLPGVTIRFWGLESHANSMAPLALVYLLFAIHQPFERRWLQWLGLVLGSAVFVLAQSKTTWIAGIMAFSLLASSRSRGWAPAVLCALVPAILVALAVLLLPLLGVSFDPLLARHGRDLAELDGRDEIWSLAIQEWTRNPMFGYGITMWNEAYRMQIGLDHAVSAHNQFLQSLSMAGAVGLLGLLVYLGTLSYYALRASRGSRGLSVAMFVVLLLRCFTETPLWLDGALSGACVTHLLLFQIALAHGHRVSRFARPVASLPAAGRPA